MVPLRLANDASRMSNQGVQGNGAIGVGSNLTVRGNNAIAVSTEISSKGSDAVAVGTGAQATLANSIAIGKNPGCDGIHGTAALGKGDSIGFNTQALGEDSVAIGSGVDANAAALAQTRQSVALRWSAKATGTTSGCHWFQMLRRQEHNQPLLVTIPVQRAIVDCHWW